MSSSCTRDPVRVILTNQFRLSTPPEVGPELHYLPFAINERFTSFGHACVPLSLMALTHGHRNTQKPSLRRSH